MDHLTSKSSSPTVKVGDKILAGTLGVTSEVKSVTKLPDTNVEILLDWGPEFGTSKVYLHDYGKYWRFKNEVN